MAEQVLAYSLAEGRDGKKDAPFYRKSGPMKAVLGDSIPSLILPLNHQFYMDSFNTDQLLGRQKKPPQDYVTVEEPATATWRA
ncbi:protein of unknown function [Candidatus Methylocalor cossyra]|uniref:Uncharacterized protein n=1 Tax=Candidatus Methylocalor cossyra TaxID=3108543 RepID=A0ABP1C9E5_9GAMM